MRRRRENRRLTAVLIVGETLALGVVLMLLGTYIWMSLCGYYEVLVRTNTHGEHNAELALLCVIAALVGGDIVRRLIRLRREWFGGTASNIIGGWVDDGGERLRWQMNRAERYVAGTGISYPHSPERGGS